MRWKGCKKGKYMVGLGSWRFMENWNYNPAHFPRHRIWDQVNSGCNWKVCSLNCFQIWLPSHADFSSYSFTILLPHPFFSLWGNLNSLHSKELSRNKWNSCRLDLLPEWIPTRSILPHCSVQAGSVRCEQGSHRWPLSIQGMSCSCFALDSWSLKNYSTVKI